MCALSLTIESNLSTRLLTAEAQCRESKDRSNQVSAHIGLGQPYYDLKYYDESLKAFEQAIVLRPDDIWSHMGMGSIYVELGNNDAAMREHDTLRRISSSLQSACANKTGFLP